MKFQQVELSKKVAAELPAAWTAESYKVDSDSGAKYYITLMSKGGELTLALCTCPDAQFKLPLVAIGAYQCKHAKALLATPTTAIQDEEPLPEPIQREGGNHGEAGQ